MKSLWTGVGDDGIEQGLHSCSDDSQSTWQMKLLATSDTTQVICTVSTACAPVCDSNIQFYTTDWKELPISDFITAMPAMDDFFETPILLLPMSIIMPAYKRICC